MEQDKSASALKTECSNLAKASYKCMENNAENAAQICKSFFDEYKACRKAGNEFGN